VLIRESKLVSGQNLKAGDSSQQGGGTKSEGKGIKSNRFAIFSKPVCS
jgi:hypothetical protein